MTFFRREFVLYGFVSSHRRSHLKIAVDLFSLRLSGPAEGGEIYRDSQWLVIFIFFALYNLFSIASRPF